MSRRTYVGFGFGAIQSGLFLYEAFQSWKFDRLVVAEVVPEWVEAIRANRGHYALNVATETRVEKHDIGEIEIYNPAVAEDRVRLIEALAEAKEIATALPSVDFYTRGAPSVSDLLREAFEEKRNDERLPPCVVYTAENNNHAAEILEKAVGLDATGGKIQFLNTVICKMSQVVDDPAVIAREDLEAVAPGLPRAFLVESFNRILISRITLPDFQRGLSVFQEKRDLLPFEEAKLYGHNATHALIGYLAKEKGYTFMSEAKQDPELFALAREAFLQESGAALIQKNGGVDPLFTEEGYRAYAEDLLERMTNPFLQDQVDRIIRDPRRKLAWNDRLIGTMRLALDAGIEPRRFAQGARAALKILKPEMPGQTDKQILDSLWGSPPEGLPQRERLIDLICGSGPA